jgi:hypothetical protein
MASVGIRKRVSARTDRITYRSGGSWTTAPRAPWLVGSGEPEQEVPPEELFGRLKPFKDRVADDIRGDEE